MTTQSEIDRLSKMCSAYSVLVSLLEEQLSYVQEQSAKQREAGLTLESERGTNSLLTNEIQELETKIKRVAGLFFRLQTRAALSSEFSVAMTRDYSLRAAWSDLQVEFP